MAYLFTSESVSEGHPDKVADQISDALIDNFLAFDADSKVACETLVTTGQVILAGEVKSNTYLDVQSIAREVIKKLGDRGLGETGKSYAIDKAIEKLFGEFEERFISYDMQNGIDTEPLAFAKFKELKYLEFLEEEDCLVELIFYL